MAFRYNSTVPVAATGHRVYMPRGRMLGGSSSINAMIYARGNPADYDYWRDGFGAQGWGYADVLPYFLRAEDNARLGAPWHGKGGPLRVEDPLEIHELQQAWLNAAVKWGLPASEDFNAGRQIGAGPYQLTCRDGRRWSSADALMLSGIGPAEQLRALGIDVAADLSGVGENLHDHPTTVLVWATKGTTDLGQLAATTEAAQLWQRDHRGPLASNFADVGGFLATNGNPDLPDIQMYPVATGYQY